MLSTYRAECQLVGTKLAGEERQLYLDAHGDVCDCNHTGSTGTMETEGAKIMWKRSVVVGSFRYTALLGDGDAAVVISMNAIESYTGLTVEKEVCINHEAKRMYKGLEKLVKDVNAKVKQNKAVCAAGKKNADFATRQAVKEEGPGEEER